MKEMNMRIEGMNKESVNGVNGVNVCQNHNARQDWDESMLFKYLTEYRQQLLHKRLPILADCVVNLRARLNNPELSLWDLRMMTTVLLESNLRDGERASLIECLYEHINRNPAWLEKGHTFWIEGQLKRYKDARRKPFHAFPKAVASDVQYMDKAA